MKKIGIIVAMQKEWDALFSQYGMGNSGYLEGVTSGGVPCFAMLSGIGKVNAAVCAYRLLKEYDVNEILSFGCAGGMTNEVSVGGVVIGDSYCYHDVWCGKPNQQGQVQGAPMFYPSNYKEWMWLHEGMKEGLISSGDALCDSELMAGAIVQSLGRNPLAVDMESAAIAQVCYKYSAHFTSIRVISDNPLLGEHADMYNNFWASKDEPLAEIMRNFMTYHYEENSEF